MNTKIHYPQTLSQNIADWREIADLPKPVKDPSIVSLDEYQNGVQYSRDRIRRFQAYWGEPIEAFEIPDNYKNRVSIAILCERNKYLTRLIREGKIRFK
jgi:hypothetical protein